MNRNFSILLVAAIGRIADSSSSGFILFSSRRAIKELLEILRSSDSYPSDLVCQPVSNFSGAERATQFSRSLPFSQCSPHSRFDSLRLSLPTEIFEHHAYREYSAHWIRDAFAGDVRRRAVDRFEERNLAGMNIARRR